MKALEILRARQAELVEQRDAAIEAMEAVAEAALTEERSLSDDDSAEVEARQAEIAGLDEELAALDEREAELVKIQERTEARAARPSLQVISSPEPTDVFEDRAATPTQLADALTRSLEDRVESPENLAHVRKVAKRHSSDRVWARNLVARASDTYDSAFGKVLSGQTWTLTSEESRALSYGTAADGGYLLPTHLDPTIILTNDGSSNVMRSIARVVTLTAPGDSSWQGITSAGATSTWTAELAEVTESNPTFGQPTIPVHKAAHAMTASIEWVQDSGAASELLALFADARDRLEGAAHVSGTGSDQPTGIVTALDANTNVEISLDDQTTNAIVKADLDEVYRSVPIRWRGNSTWLTHPEYGLEVQNLGTAVSANYTTTLADAPSMRWLGRPVVESDDFPSSSDGATTTVDARLVFGDFSNYVIVDKPGSMSVQSFPVLNGSNNLPDGRAGWVVYWRTGADSVNDLAFRILQDNTTA